MGVAGTAERVVEYKAKRRWGNMWGKLEKQECSWGMCIYAFLHVLPGLES